MQSRAINNLKLLLAIMTDEVIAHLLGIGIDVSADLGDYGKPDIFGADRQMMVGAVCVER
jgi:hypothetical protein